jgi:electron transport complex protein RnfG
MSEQKLPMAEPGGGGAGGQPPVQVSTSSVRLVGTLALAGALAGLAIVLVFQWAKPRIDEYQARMLAEAVTEVLGGAARYETVYIQEGRLTPQPTDTTGLDRVYVGYDEVDRPVGVALVAAESGFQDVIRLIFGYDPGTGEVLGMKVLESKETPGLGDKIEKDSTFIREFLGVGTPLVGVKPDRATDAREEVVMITGATISSRAIIDIINHRLEALGDPVSTYWSSSLASGSPAQTAPAAAVPSTGGGA